MAKGKTLIFLDQSKRYYIKCLARVGFNKRPTDIKSENIKII